MIEMLKKIITKVSTFIKDDWNIYGSLILSYFISQFLEWNVSQLMKVNQFLGVVLTMFVLLTIIKKQLFPRKKPNIVEKIVDTNKQVKTMNLGLETDKKIDDTRVLIETTLKGGKKFMSKIKKFFKWLITYWQQVIGLIGALVYSTIVMYCLISDKLSFLYDKLPATQGWQLGIKITIGVISGLLVILIVRNQVKWVGVGSIKTAQEYMENLSKTLANSSQVDDKTRKTIKEYISNFKKKLKLEKPELVKAKEIYNEAVDKLNEFKQFEKLGLSYDSTEYQKAIEKVNQAQTELTKVQQTYDNLIQLITSYESALDKIEKE